MLEKQILGGKYKESKSFVHIYAALSASYRFGISEHTKK